MITNLNKKLFHSVRVISSWKTAKTNYAKLWKRETRCVIESQLWYERRYECNSAYHHYQIHTTALDTETKKFQVTSSQRQLGILPCFPHPTDQPVESSMWASQAASMSLSDQGIHCCSGSGYSLTTGPHPALLAVHCCFEQSCLLMPGSLTWISRESFRRRRGEECLGRKKKRLLHNHHLP